MTRQKRIWSIVFVGFLVVLLAVVSAVEFAPRIIWNATPSAPIGLYRIVDKSPKFGDWVLVEPRSEVQEFIESRAYLPPDTPLLKRVAAKNGDEICRENEQIFVRKIYIADALVVDSHGREMPQWSGCFVLGEDQYFLLNEHSKSLDGRYFGKTHSNEIIGVAVPVWLQKENNEEFEDSDKESTEYNARLKFLIYGKIKGTALRAVQSQSAHQKNSATVDKVGANERHPHDRR